VASPETAEMTEKQLSATDAALRERITELSVHIPCGRLRGPVQRRGRWQSCPDEDSPERWEDCDVSRTRDLCIVCFKGTAGGISRWAWLGARAARRHPHRTGSAPRIHRQPGPRERHLKSQPPPTPPSPAATNSMNVRSPLPAFVVSTSG
jgi:hypothetical protein